MPVDEPLESVGAPQELHVLDVRLAEDWIEQLRRWEGDDEAQLRGRAEQIVEML